MPSLSQKYRPKTFADITGQQHVTETLRREAATGILGHAYLFSGPRGVGKTTAARVFAKALNCLEPKDGEPCNACAICVSANEGRLIDLIELDAATHTGVDMVREAIIEHSRFAPMSAKRKVYILDEAHMLSTSSWNALLKTLEEPPAHAFFILATTEWHKVPATIVSRCQRFAFNRIPDEAIAKRIKEIVETEGWKLDRDVVALVVARAEGCLRDAETLLGQLGSLGEKNITRDIASLVIPESHLPLAAGLMIFWADRDLAGSLNEARRLAEDGVSILQLFDDLLLVIRKLLSGVSAQASDPWAPLMDRFTPMELHDLALMLMERRRDVKGGVDALFALQLACAAATSRSVGMAANPVISTEAKPSRPPVAPPSQGGEAAASPPYEGGERGGLDLSVVRAKWNAFIRAVDEQNHSLPFILKTARTEAVEGNTVVIRFQYPFHYDKIVGDARHRKIVEACLNKILGTEGITIRGVVGEDASRAEERSTDMVSNILKAFGGQIVE